MRWVYHFERVCPHDRVCHHERGVSSHEVLVITVQLVCDLYTLTLHLVTCVLRYSLVGVSCHSSSHNMMYSPLYIVRNQMNWKMMGRRECCQ